VQPKLSLLVGAPFEKTSFFVCAEIVESAANDEVASTAAIRTEMKVVFVGTDIVVAACSKNIAGSVDNRALAGVVWPHKDIETR